MKTLVTDSLEKAVELLSKGELVAIPTETVYGLAADALNENAVKKIFEAKGRPGDNPLIVHISEIEEIIPLVKNFPLMAQKIAQKFWPGPLTMILKKSDLIPEIVTAGLDSIAIRLPSMPLTRELIKKFGHPLAAPSANLSGRPSPTSYRHVLDDLDGKIAAILKSEDCSVGVESTVIDLTSTPVHLLRPGKITAEEISDFIGEKVIIDKSVDHFVSDLREIRSPGVKYKHYSPRTKVVLVKSSPKKFADFVNSNPDCVAVAFDEDSKYINTEFVSYGSESSQNDQLRLLFDSLRKIDSFNKKIAYVRLAPNLNLAVFNRLLRASAFNVIDDL